MTNPNGTKVLSSRRSYEYRPDELRLTVLTVPAVQQHIKQLFEFQLAQVGTPMETFGPVHATIPPGLAFDYGVWVTPDSELVPIRFLHFEQRRIVIDVAGPTSAIEPIFARLIDSLSAVKTPEGTPAIGTHVEELDYSEIAVPLVADLKGVFLPGVSDLFAHAAGLDESDPEAVMVPSVTIQVQRKDVEYPGMTINNRHSAQLTLRAGTKPGESLYFSAASLNSDSHLRYLESLEKVLIDQAPTR